MGKVPRPRRHLAFLALGALACSPRVPGAPSKAALGGAPPEAVASAPLPSSLPPASPSPFEVAPRPVVVTLVVDQLAAWVLEERWPLLPSDGGFARLIREGTYVHDLRYGHAVCDTAPGHASLFTGATPREHGIFANEVWVSEGSKKSILADPATRLVALPEGVQPMEGSSLRVLRVPTVADELRRIHPDAVVLSFSLKDRGALFSAGRSPTDALWYDAAQGRFATSTAFASTLPPWLVQGGKALTPWSQEPSWLGPLHPAWVRLHGRADDGEGEGHLLGLGRAFPHPWTTAQSPPKAFRATPFADRLLFELAVRALEARDTGKGPLLLSLSLSAFDYIGHVYGPESWEAWDALDRLDSALSAFLRRLDGRYGPTGYAVLLTADHGVTPTPESASPPTDRPWCRTNQPDRWERPCTPGARLIPRRLSLALEAAAQKVAGPGPWVLGVADPYVMFTPAFHGLPEARQRLILDAVVASLKGTPGVRTVVERKEFLRSCPAGDSPETLVCWSTGEGAPGDLYVVPTPGSFFDAEYTEGEGTSHGTPYVFDRSVPFLVRAPGRAPASLNIEGPLSFRSFAVTLSALLGLAPPRAAEAGSKLVR